MTLPQRISKDIKKSIRKAHLGIDYEYISNFYYHTIKFYNPLNATHVRGAVNLNGTIMIVKVVRA